MQPISSAAPLYVSWLWLPHNLVISARKHWQGAVKAPLPKTATPLWEAQLLISPQRPALVCVYLWPSREGCLPSPVLSRRQSVRFNLLKMTETARLEMGRAEPIKVDGDVFTRERPVLLAFVTEPSRRGLVKEIWDAASRFLDAFHILSEECCHWVRSSTLCSNKDPSRPQTALEAKRGVGCH